MWSDLIHVTLWRNDRFFHSFCNFSKSNEIKCKFDKNEVYSSIYVEKITKNHLWEDMTVLRRRGRLMTKINTTFLVGNEVPNIFHRTTFLKKTIFFKIIAKNNFQVARPFFRNGALDDKNEYNLFYGKRGTEYRFEVFSSKKPIPAE